MVEVKIVLDDAPRSYNMGEAIRGHVLVESDAPFKCNKLTLQIVCEFKGKSVKQKETLWSTTLTQGQIGAGAQRFEFECHAPKEHFSYEGEEIFNKIEMEAHLDLPWAVDKKAHTTLEILPTTCLTPEAPAPKALSVSESHGEDIKQVTRAAIVMFFMGIGLSVMPFFLFLYSDNFDAPRQLLIALSFLVWMGLFSSLALKVFRMKRGASAMQDVTVRFGSYPMTLGEAQQVMFEFTAGRDLTLREVTIDLTPLEHMLYKSGRTNIVIRRNLHEDVQTLATNMSLTKGQKYALPVSFSCPAQMPPSMQLQAFSTRWEVQVHVGIDDWPDFKHEQVVEVRAPYAPPEVAATGAAW